MKKRLLITLLIFASIATANADSILRGHLPKGYPLVAAALSDRPNSTYAIETARVVIDKDDLGNVDLKNIVVKIFISGESYDDKRKFYDYMLIIYEVQRNPKIEQYLNINYGFDDTNSNQYVFKSGNPNFAVSHEVRKFKKGEQFTITPLRDIPMTIILTDSTAH